MGTLGKQGRHQFASDNWSGICPEAWKALEEANQGHIEAYGDDAYTEKACDLIREFFETDCQVFFTFNGTAANSLSIATLCQSYHSIICHGHAHIEVDECGAPQFFSNGTKVLVVPGAHGKVDIEAVEKTITRRSDIHYPKVRALSLTQATEFGTVYTPAELKALCSLARKYELGVHMDGARFSNALASLDVAPRELSWEAGVDILCLGGTKNGLPVGDAVVFFDNSLAEEFAYRCKQAGQLASKMRFLSAPWVGVLSEGAYLEHARHANSCAALLEKKVLDIPGLSIKHPRQANAVFVDMPSEWFEALHDKGWVFHSFLGDGASRLMCSWDTSEEDIEAIVGDLKNVAAEHPATTED